MARMDVLSKMTGTQYENSVIAQDDSGGYDPGGYVAGIFNGVAFLSRFDHCSCYGTWTALQGKNGICLDWVGKPSELIEMAERIADPAIPERAADPQDYDYRYLVDVYKQILAKKDGIKVKYCDHMLDGETHALKWPNDLPQDHPKHSKGIRTIWNPCHPICLKCGKSIYELLNLFYIESPDKEKGGE